MLVSRRAPRAEAQLEVASASAVWLHARWQLRVHRGQLEPGPRPPSHRGEAAPQRARPAIFITYLNLYIIHNNNNNNNDNNNPCPSKYAYIR